MNARTKFKYQFEIIKNAKTEKSLLIGDFNMDYAKIYDDNYSHRKLFDDFEEALSESNLIQMVKH